MLFKDLKPGDFFRAKNDEGWIWMKICSSIELTEDDADDSNSVVISAPEDCYCLDWCPDNFEVIKLNVEMIMRINNDN